MSARLSRVLSRGRPRFTLRGWGIIVAAGVVFVAASVISNRDLLLLGCLLAAMPVVALLHLQLRRSSLSVRRSFSPDVVSVGAPCLVAVEVTNQARRAVEASLCRDENGMTGPSPELELPRLERAVADRVNPRSAVTVKYTITPTERGLHSIGPLVVHRADLLGLAVFDHVYGETGQLAVAPRVVPLDSDQITTAGPEGAIDASRLTSTGGADDTLPREYRPGDAMRRVHWRATARYGDLMVRQDEQQDDPECWILLDNWLVNHGRPHRVSSQSRGLTSDSFEWAVQMTASIATHAQEEGYLARVVRTAEPGPIAEEQQSEHDLLLELAAVTLMGGRVDPDYIHLLADSMRAHGGSRPVFAVLGDIGDDEAEQLAALVPLSRSATAFLVNATGRGATLLKQFGWRCVQVADDDDVRAAWADAASDSRSARVW